MKIGETAFSNLKPTNVKKANHTQMSTCTCQTHENSYRSLKAMAAMRRLILEKCPTCQGEPNAQCDRGHSKLCGVDVFNSLSMTWGKALCPKRPGAEYHKRSCLMGWCPSCGPRTTIAECPLFNWAAEEVGAVEVSDDYKVKVTYFGGIDITRADGTPVLDEDGKTKKKVGLIQKAMGPKELAEHFRSYVLHKMPPHQFRALWQWQQFQQMQRNLPVGEAVVVMDFSENHSMLTAGAVQSCHWTQNYCTLHVAIVYRHAVLSVDGEESTPEAPIIVKDIFDFVSDDIKHDMHFVHECQRRMYVDYYREELGIRFTGVHEWTDGCASQYKSSNVFGDLANKWREDFGMPINRHYFEVNQ